MTADFPNPQDGINALRIIRDHAILWDERTEKARDFAITTALIELSIAEIGKNGLEWSYLYRELYDRLSVQRKVPGWQPAEEPSLQRLKGKRGMGLAIALLQHKADAIEHALAKNGCSWMPVWEHVKSKGGSGNEARFKLSWRRIEVTPAPEALPQTTVRYELVHHERANLFWRTMTWPLQSDRFAVRLLFPGLLMLLAIWVAVTLWWSIEMMLRPQGWQKVSAALLLACGLPMVWSIWRSIMAALEFNWAAAPWPLQTLNDDLIWRFYRPDAAKYRRLVQVRYKGSCPRCEAPMRIKRRPGSGPQDLIGVCDNAPAFHRASFDPIHEIGDFLAPERG